MIHDFFKCEVCGKELKSTNEQKVIVDKQGFTRVYCDICFMDVEK